MKKILLGYLLQIILTCICLFIYAISSNVVTHYTTSDYQLKDPLRDLIKLDNQKYHLFYDIVYTIPFAAMILCAIILISQFVLKKRDFIMDAFFCESISMTLKGLMQILTILPDSNPNNIYCHLPKPKYYEINLDSCGNMIWSGHMTHLIFAVYWVRCVIKEYKLNPLLYDLFSGALIIFEGFMLSSFQIHYSVDVILAVIFSYGFVTHPIRENFIKKYRSFFEDSIDEIIILPTPTPQIHNYVHNLNQNHAHVYDQKNIENFGHVDNLSSQFLDEPLNAPDIIDDLPIERIRQLSRQMISNNQPPNIQPLNNQLQDNQQFAIGPSVIVDEFKE